MLRSVLQTQERRYYRRRTQDLGYGKDIFSKRNFQTFFFKNKNIAK